MSSLFAFLERLKKRMDEHWLFRAIQFNLLRKYLLSLAPLLVQCSHETKQTKNMIKGLFWSNDTFKVSLSDFILNLNFTADPFFLKIKFNQSSPNSCSQIKFLLFLLYLAPQIKFYWKYCLKCLNNWSNLLEIWENQLQHSQDWTY